MKKNRKLLANAKRFLALLLAVAMVTGELPSSIVHAAEQPAAVNETVDEPGSVDVSDADTAVADVSEGDGDVRKSDGEEPAPAVPETLKTEIVLNEAGLKTAVTTALPAKKYEFADDALKVTALYDPDKPTYAEDVVTAVKANVTVKVDNVVKAALKNNVEYKWQKQGEDGAYADMALGEVPTAVGMYKLVASLPAEPKECSAIEAQDMVSLEVKKAVLSFDVDNLRKNVRPGITVAEAVKRLAKAEFIVNGDTANPKAQELYASAVSVEIEEAYSSEKLTDPAATLEKNQDYRVVFTVTLKEDAANSFELEKDNFVIHFKAAVATTIKVTYTDVALLPGAIPEISKVYGDETDLEAKVKAAYTAKVVAVYQDDKGNDKEQELKDAVIAETWCDADKIPCAAPVDAGVYYYMLSYTDENGSYQDSVAYIKAEIKMADIVIVPKLDPAETYEGLTANTILKKVPYEVYQLKLQADGSKLRSETAEKIDEYYWGVAYNDNDKTRTQSYEPRFVIQKAVKEAKDPKQPKEFTATGEWETLTAGTKLELKDDKKVTVDGKTETVSVPNEYRIVFSGKKAVYTANGGALEKDINDAQKNYHVDFSDASVEKYKLAQALTVKEATEVEIKVDDIPIFDETKVKNGATLYTAIEKVYDGKCLYATKDLYKKATVATKAGESVSAGSLTYTWQDATSWVQEKDADGKDIWAVSKNGWTTSTLYNDVEVASSPYNKGVYRLHIEFNDATGAYRKATKDLYYIIRPQDAIAVLTGAPEIFADGKNTVASLLYKLQRTNPDDKETYVDIQVYPVTVTEDAAGKVTAVKGENPIDAFVIANEIRQTYKYPATYFCVEKPILEGKDKGKWEICNNNEVLEKGVEYRLNICNYNVDTDYSGAYNTDLANYNFGKKFDLPNLNSVLIASNYFENETVPVTLKDTEAVKVEIVLDEEQITGNTKIYDGKPFDLTLLKSLVKVRTYNEGTDVTDEVAPKLRYWFKHSNTHGTSLDNYQINADYAVHADTYTLIINMPTDEKYLAVSTEDADQKSIAKKFIIEQKEIDVKPVLKESIGAGYWQLTKDILAGYDNNAYFVIETPLAEGDEKVISAVTFDVKDASDKKDTYLRSTKPYYVKATGYTWVSRRDENYSSSVNPFSYSMDYKVRAVAEAFTPKRMAAHVEAYNVRWNTGSTPYKYDQTGFSTTYGTKLNDAVEEKDGKFTHTITALEGVPYIYKSWGFDVDNDGSDEEGNYFLFNLFEPEEFFGDVTNISTSDFIYRNRIEQSVENAGGYVYSNTDRYITVAFDAGLGGKPSFDVIWDKDYVESYTVDLDQMKALLEANLEQAVSPKSLAFNGVSTKMMVGETQQLDVKMTKNQMSDIICLGYSSSDPKVLQVTDSGFVTALSVSKQPVVVTVYPCRMVNGVKTRITDKGVKTATVKITVSKVSAPKLGKVAAWDTYAEVTYPKPVNGYRREVYVLQGKQKKEDFEAKIAAVKNGDFSAFAYKNLDKDAEVLVDPKKGTMKVTATGLAPATEYTIYVRNVTGLRTLYSDVQVQGDPAAFDGTVKTFKTTLSQIKQLKLYFDKELKGQTAFNSETVSPSDFKDYAGVKVGSELYNHYYEAKLTDKSAKLSVDGKFWERYSKNYSDTWDYIWRTLPLKDLTKTYQQPKMVYYTSEERINWTLYPTKEAAEKAAKDKWGEKNYVEVGSYFYSKVASIAGIDKSGKVSFKGCGYVFVVAVDTISGEYDIVYLNIKANPDSVTAKPAKILTGQSIYLSELLEFKEGKTKIVDYTKPHYSILSELTTGSTTTFVRYYDLSTDAESNSYFDVERVKRNNIYDFKVTALKSDKTSKLEKEVTDATVAANGGKPAKVKITAAPVEAVKSLKPSVVYDDRFNMAFTYSLPSYKFRVELKDARGSVITNQILELNGTQDTKSKKPLYRYGLSFNTLTLLSTYKVTVTAICGDQTSKPVTATVKTTNIPASYKILIPTDMNTGMQIEVCTSNKAGTYRLSNNPVLKSGNTYTLRALAENFVGAGRTDASDRATDKLVWKSSNTKVATVKANKETFSAKLKVMQQGTTVIEVTSKNSKQVIARWRVRVAATGDADNYFADNEPYKNWNSGRLKDLLPILEQDQLELKVGNPITVNLNRGEEQLFVFTAPARGEYKYTSANGGNGSWSWSADFPAGSWDALKSAYVLEKGQKAYVYVKNTGAQDWATAGITGTLYDEVSLTGDNKVKGGKTFYFVAPEDNYYTFTRLDGTEDEDEKKAAEGNLGRYGLKAGQTAEIPVGGSSDKEYNIVITKREIKGEIKVGADPIQISLKELDGVKEDVWYRFTWTEDPTRYQLNFANLKDGQLKVEIFEDLSWTPYDGRIRDFTITADGDTAERGVLKDKTLYFRIVPSVVDDPSTSEIPEVPAEGSTPAIPAVPAHEGKPVTAALTIKVRTAAEVTEETPVSVSIGAAPKWCEFTAKTAGYYIFYTSDATALITADHTGDISQNGIDGSLVTMSNNKDVKGEVYLDEGETVYLKLTATSATDAAPVTAKLNVKKRAVEATVAVGTAADISLKSDDVKWYEFQASEYNNYVFYTTGANKKLKVTLYTSFVDDDNSLYGTYTPATGNDVTTAVIPRFSRDKVWVKVEPGEDLDETTTLTAKLNVKGSKVEKTLTIGTGEAVELAQNEEQWYKFVADEKNYYTISYKSAADSPGDATMKIYDKMVGGTALSTKTVAANSSGKINLGTLEKGTVRYINLITTEDTSSKKVTVTLTVNKRVPEVLTLGDSGVSVEIGENEEKWYKFTSAEDNCYTFYSDNVQKATITAEYYTTLTGTSQDTVTSTTPSATVNGEFTMSEKQIKNEKTVYVRLTSAATGGDKATATLKVKKRVSSGEALAVGGDGKAVSLDDKAVVFYEFTASENNSYTFYAENVDNGSFKVTYYEELDSPTGSSTTSSGAKLSLTKFVLNNGKKAYVKVEATATDKTKKVTMTLKVKKREVATNPLVLDGDGAGVELTKDDNEKWYSFTSTEDNCYTLYSDNLTAGGVSVTIYSDYRRGTIVTGGGTQTFSTKEFNMPEVMIKKGTTVYVRVVGDPAPTGDTKITLSLKVKNRKVETEELTMADTGLSLSLPKVGDEKWYKFSSTDDTEYTFYAEDVKGSFTAEFYEKLTDVGHNGTVSSSGTTFTMKKHIDASATRYVKFTADTIDGENPAKATVKVKARKAETTPLTVGGAGVEFSLTDDSKWYVFEPTVSDRYIFNVTGASKNTSVTCYRHDPDNDINGLVGDYTGGSLMSGSGSGDFVIDTYEDAGAGIYVKANTKVYVSVYSYYATKDAPVTGKLSVKAVVDSANRKTVTDIENGNPETFTVDTANNTEVKWYAFTASEAGSYELKVSKVETDGTRYVEVYTEYISSVYSDDDKGTGDLTYQFYNVKKGETLYVRVNVSATEAAKTKLEMCYVVE